MDRLSWREAGGMRSGEDKCARSEKRAKSSSASRTTQAKVRSFVGHGEVHGVSSSGLLGWPSCQDIKPGIDSTLCRPKYPAVCTADLYNINENDLSIKSRLVVQNRRILTLKRWQAN